MLSLIVMLASITVQANNFSYQVISEAQATLGQHYSSLELQHSTFDPYLKNCESLQYQSNATLHLGRQYINVSGCGHNKRVAITLSAMVAIPLANHTIGKNTILSSEHFSVKQIKISKDLKYFIAFDALLGRTTSKQIHQGKWLTQKSLQKDYWVERGSLVNYRVQQHGFTITTEMLARDNGLLGQVIRVSHPISKKKLTAVITGHNQVSAISR